MKPVDNASEASAATSEARSVGGLGGLPPGRTTVGPSGGESRPRETSDRAGLSADLRATLARLSELLLLLLQILRNHSRALDRELLDLAIL